MPWGVLTRYSRRTALDALQGAARHEKEWEVYSSRGGEGGACSSMASEEHRIGDADEAASCMSFLFRVGMGKGECPGGFRPAGASAFSYGET